MATFQDIRQNKNGWLEGENNNVLQENEENGDKKNYNFYKNKKNENKYIGI